MNQDEEGIDWELAASDFIEQEAPARLQPARSGCQLRYMSGLIHLNECTLSMAILNIQ